MFWNIRTKVYKKKSKIIIKNWKPIIKHSSKYYKDNLLKKQEFI